VNYFQWSVIHGLGWFTVLFDGWVLHSHWLALAGLVMLVASLYFMVKEGD
jgi:hypothetical protein